MSMQFFTSDPSSVHGARISGLEARMNIVEDRICDLDARGSEEADNIANERELDRFIITGESWVIFRVNLMQIVLCMVIQLILLFVESLSILPCS